MESIGKIRRDHFVHGKSIKTIARERGVSRNTVRKVLRTQETAFHYERSKQPMPRLGERVDALEAMLEANKTAPRRERLTLKRMFELLQGEGYDGGYDAVRRYGRRWQRDHGTSLDAYVPLTFAPGEAFQFDFSHEYVVLDGVTTKAKVAHVRLCHSRMGIVQAYPRESQEMVFDAHAVAFKFYGGTCTRGIYDNMKTAVDSVLVGKDRKFNRRFEQMCSHYLIEPVACTPGAGWEKGQVENQVGNTRERLFTPKLHLPSFRDLNAYLLEKCVADAKTRSHPDDPDRTVYEVFEAERSALIPYTGPFDGYRSRLATVSKTCLVRFDHNHYSVMAKAVGRPVEIQAYADRVVIRQDGQIVGDHPRRFGRAQSVFDPWHYLPVLAKKPGALRNGAPFKGWPLPAAIAEMQRRLMQVKGGDRQMVDILSAVISDGLDAVDAACAEALGADLASRDVVLNTLTRREQPAPAKNIATPNGLDLTDPPRADCSRYDELRGAHAAR